MYLYDPPYNIYIIQCACVCVCVLYSFANIITFYDDCAELKITFIVQILITVFYTVLQLLLSQSYYYYYTVLDISVCCLMKNVYYVLLMVNIIWVINAKGYLFYFLCTYQLFQTVNDCRPNYQPQVKVGAYTRVKTFQVFKTNENCILFNMSKNPARE